jgi:Kef-type K+ transport system membrane component KefB
VLFLGQALLLIAVPFALWRLPLVRRAVPLVVVQILLGIVLGPSLLGRLAPDLAGLLLPASSLGRLSGAAWLGVLFFAFLAGLHLDLGETIQRGRATLAIGLSSMIVPFAGGIALGFWLVGHLPGLMGPNATGAGFIVAIGLCVSVTALPVLGAILHETGLIRHELGRLALSCAALNDVLLWLIMAALLATLGAPGTGLGAFAATLALSLLYFGLMAVVARPLLARLFTRSPAWRDWHVVLVVALLLASALATEAIGLHYLIGAFAAGVIVPKAVAGRIVALLEPFTVIVLLPFFFVVTGLNVTLDFGSAALLAVFGGSTLVAMAGKILGTTLPARAAGRSWRDALSLGALMQCKGMMEVIVLTVLLEAGFVSVAAFSALILMALVTTALTMPMVRAIMGASLRAQ